MEDLLFERGIDICHETVRFWWNRFGPMFASDIKRQRINRMRGFRQWRWHLDEMLVMDQSALGAQSCRFPLIGDLRTPVAGLALLKLSKIQLMLGTPHWASAI